MLVASGLGGAMVGVWFRRVRLTAARTLVVGLCMSVLSAFLGFGALYVAVEKFSHPLNAFIFVVFISAHYGLEAAPFWIVATVVVRRLLSG